MSKNSWLLLIFIILLPLLVFISWPSKQAHLISCNVGQGDALLITQGFSQILIDGGPDNKVLDCLGENMPFWDRKIELVVNTHPEKDHITGLIEVVEQYQVEKLLINDFWQESEVFNAFYQEVKDKKIAIYSPKAGDKVYISDFELDVLWPEEPLSYGIWQPQTKNKPAILGAKTKIKANDYSIVIHLKRQEIDLLLTGDISSQIEEKIIKDFNLSDIEILKVSHHGSKYSTSENFLQAIKPQIAIICVGKNSFGHPTDEVLNRLKNIGAKILRTDNDKIKIKI